MARKPKTFDSDIPKAEPGVFAGLTFDQYAAIDAVNASVLKPFRRSPAHALNKMIAPDPPSRALVIGQALHSRLFDDNWHNDYTVAPKIDRRTKKGKAQWAEFEDNAEGKIILTSDEHTDVCEWSNSVMSQGGDATQLIKAKGHNELTVVWEDPKTQLMCKARLDRVVQWNEWTCVVDVKTTTDASYWSFEKAVHQYGYHESASWYLDGLNAHHQRDRKYIFIVIEKTTLPHGANVTQFQLEQDALDQGRRNMRRYLNLYAKCRMEQKWPGYSDKLEAISIPRYGFDAEGNLD